MAETCPLTQQPVQNNPCPMDNMPMPTQDNACGGGKPKK
jgi:hypothetical protein